MTDKPLHPMTAEQELYGALRWLMDDLRDADEDRDQDTDEMFDSCHHANNLLMKHKHLACKHNSMVRNEGDRLRAWKCAICGYVYG